MPPASYRLRVFGHEWAQRLLRSAIVSGRTSHAYLFAGPDQVGKTTLARAFAQALTCLAPQADVGLGACGACRACRLAAEAGYPDHRLIEPDGKQIKIEQVRALIHEANLSPVEGRFKVFIIRNFDRANVNSANALLKTLEEPSATTRILLTSSQAASLLPTITSRCQVLQLRPLAGPAVAAALQEQWQTPASDAALLGELSGGRLGWAVNMATNAEAWQAYRKQLAAAQALARQDPVERLAYAAQLAQGGEAETVLRGWLLWWRDVLLLQQQCPDLVLNQDQIQEVRTMAETTRPGEVRRFLQALITTAGYLRRNVQPQLALEALLLKTPQAA